MYKLALIGTPIEHSMSPFIYAEMFDNAKTDGVFELITLTQLDDLRNEILMRDIDAFAVTMPYKRIIIPYLDGISDDAMCAGSVNLVTVSHGRFFGHTTDGEGFIRSLPVSPQGRDIIIYGTGGAARSLVAALKKYDVNITVTDRKYVRACEFAAEFRVSVCADLRSIPHATVFVNATPAGMNGQVGFTSFDFLDRLQMCSIVADMIYDPMDTLLMQAARRRGFTAINGSGMLRKQAEAAFDIIRNS